jgi:hypothetical protein
MTVLKRLPKPLRRLVVVVGTVASLWLLYRFIDPNGPNWTELEWTESVQLASGETVQIKRYLMLEQHSMWGMGGMSSGQWYEQSWIELVDAGASFPRWSAQLLPNYLDKDPVTGEWIVVAVEDGDRLWAHNGSPCPPQWAFRLRGGTWYMQPIPKEFLGRKANLLIDINSGDDKRLIGSRFRKNIEKRKAEQFSLPPRVPLSFTTVGGNTKLPNYCDKYSEPTFTQEFPKNFEGHLAIDFQRMN